MTEKYYNCSTKMLDISATGVRSGEFLTSHPNSKQNKGSIIQVRGANYPPYKDYVKSLKFTDFRDKISKLPFFSKMTSEQIKKYLLDASTTQKKVFLEHIAGMEIRFIEMAGTKFTPEIMKVLSDGTFRPAEEVSRLFDDRGSKSVSKNMVFRASNWIVMDISPMIVNVDGVVVGSDGSTEYISGFVDTNNWVVTQDNIVIVVDNDVPPYTMSDIDPFVDKDVRKLLIWATPAIHKSLVQKMIRTRCVTCTHEGKQYSAKDVLITSFIMLMEHPGVYNERFKEFETGLQSATKRLGVTIAEDSSINNPRELLSLFACAAYAKKFKPWKPDIELVITWIKVLLDAHDSDSMYEYQFDPVDIPIDTNPFNLSYHILADIKSLSQDIPMVGWIAKKQGQLSTVHTASRHIDIPLVHCIDQHNLTAIAWHFPYDVVHNLGSYPKLLRHVWTQSSCLNGRKYVVTTDLPFLDHLRTAQLEVWRLMSGYEKQQRKPSGNQLVMKYTLDDSWLTGIVGVINLKLGARHIISMINGNDSDEILSMVKPSRGMKPDDKKLILTEDEKAECSEIAQDVLKHGITVSPPEYLKFMGKITIKRKEMTYIVNGVPWDKFKQITISIPSCTTMEPTRQNGCLYTGHYIETDYVIKLMALYKTLSADSMSRLIIYIECVTTKIKMHNINRDGGSVYYTVAIEDTAVYNMLCGVAVIAPFAIEPIKGAFVIKNGPMFSLICDIIKSFRPSKSLTTVSSWPGVKSDNRDLYQHQADALKTLVDSSKTKQIINITAGLGKTLIVIRYFLHLIRTNKMPKYVVFSLPPSALLGVQKQFMASKFKINVMNMKKTNTNDKILPGHINFIFHDHMRKGLFSEKIGRICHELFFVVDELHFCLKDNTQRTSMAISIAKTCKLFIGMTGTLVVNDKFKQIIEWLKLVTKFEVNETNYFAALGMLISSRIETNIQVVRELIHIDLTHEQQIYHDQSFNNAVEVCYEAVTEELINLAVDYVNKKIPVFIVARNKAAQEYIISELKSLGVRRLHAITKDTPINYEPDDPRRLQVIVTTPSHSTGYTITGMSTMLTSVYFSNQATRDQLDARLNRIGQPEKQVTIVTVHTGLLSYILEKYDHVKSMSEAIKSFSELVKMDMPANKL